MKRTMTRKRAPKNPPATSLGRIVGKLDKWMDQHGQRDLGGWARYAREHLNSLLSELKQNGGKRDPHS